MTGHTFHDLIRIHQQQDADLDKLSMDVAAYTQRIMGPSHVASAVDEAIETALARRTVVHLTIPKDMQDWMQEEAPLERISRASSPSVMHLFEAPGELAHIA
jgi:pyruvate dehydrogenase (quinone)